MVVEPEGEIFVSRCPELDIATWGYTAEDTWADLAEAVELYFEAASQDQTHRRL
ncbi:MAG: type II toxin-antitoxin system HicB family antitoxin [Gemmatimonadetes bacterium]|nr:type II toxin-antitoxin system HicB family antitoxin [Gemmatimonadota bacterium]